MPGELPEVPIVPGRLDAVEDSGHVADGVPADAEPVAVRRRGAEPRIEALVDQGGGGLEERVVEQDRRSRVREPPAHGRPPGDPTGVEPCAQSNQARTGGPSGADG